MLFVSKHRPQTPQEHHTRFWDEALYAALFRDQDDGDRVHGKYFSCILTKRTTVLQHSYLHGEEHVYTGMLHVSLQKGQVCQVIVDVQLKNPDPNFDLSINRAAIGYMFLGWASASSGQKPSIHLQIKNVNDLSAQMSRLHAEARASGGKGLLIRWSAILSSMANSTAAVVWGDWDLDSPRDADGVLQPDRLPGRHAFALQSLKIEGEV